MIRSELDALPIEEKNTHDWISKYPEKAHLCGHDGHMVILAGLAKYLYENPPQKGKVVLMYQPEEETGTGALKMLVDPKFIALNPDYIFALHNLPGMSMGEIQCRKNVFAAASVGLIIRLMGKTSHAAEPEKGNSPALAMSLIIQMLESLLENIKTEDFSLLTPVHAKLGERAFGTTPGYAEIMATLRAYQNNDLLTIKEAAVQKARSIAELYNLKIEFEWVEEFSSTVNHPLAVDIIEKAAVENQFRYKEMQYPNKWSEDFGYFLQKYSGALFTIGAGENMSKLHNPDYDFPDELIPIGMKMFKSILCQINY
jgi:amidohydrolase